MAGCRPRADYTLDIEKLDAHQHLVCELHPWALGQSRQDLAADRPLLHLSRCYRLRAIDPATEALSALGLVARALRLLRTLLVLPMLHLQAA